jgi:hypothetical protein
MDAKKYQPVATNDDDVLSRLAEDGRFVVEDVEDGLVSGEASSETNGSLVTGSKLLPLSIGQDDEELLVSSSSDALFVHQGHDPSIPFGLITLFWSTPVVLGNIWLIYRLTGLCFILMPFLCHLLLVLATSRLYLSSSKPSTWSMGICACIVALIDIGLLCLFYPLVLWKILSVAFFTEVDGTTSIDWESEQKSLVAFRVLAYVSGTWRGLAALYVCYVCIAPLKNANRTKETCLGVVASPRKCSVVRYVLQCCLFLVFYAAVALLLVSLFSAMLLFSSPVVLWPFERTKAPSDCDPLDTTECWLPFPSFHALRPDTTTATGWRVHLQGHLLPPLRNLHQIQPDFLNQLDGFSTLAPLLFYIDGLKEAHEAGIGQLMGSDRLAESVTERSATFLLDVATSTLVHHTAEIDYLDGEQPMVMVFPAQPLYHNRHYALAVINARDASGQRLLPTPGMMALLHSNMTEGHDSSSIYDTNRERRYRDTVIFSLERATSWFEFATDPLALQLLFDFHTISEASQLGPVRRVRDATMSKISKSNWNWSQHVRTNRLIDYSCDDDHSILARTVHAELDVPWFLKPRGDGIFQLPRAAVLEEAEPWFHQTNRLGVAKFVVHIPCSIKAAAIGSSSTTLVKPLRAVMEFGHGLFGNRGEASDDYLLQMAHDQGYVIIAMDWRGMSTSDLPLVIKILGSTPHLFESVRDNLIQGYGCKYALQHFAKYALFLPDWLFFPIVENGALITVPCLNDEAPAFTFYGVSQGGILGAGYSALSGTTGLIDRSIIGSGGTPFALIMTRSRDFLVYDKLLLLNFYNNRHVRMLLTLVQMAWDPVEASGVLAPPVKEPYPRVLLQAGLGDVIVTTTASEVLSRAFNASTLPNNPRQVFGVSTELAADAEHLGPYATLTEVLYDSEYKKYPKDNILGKDNAIHICLRRDPAMIRQLTEFVNTGRIIDPCAIDGCRRFSANC